MVRVVEGAERDAQLGVDLRPDHGADVQQDEGREGVEAGQDVVEGFVAQGPVLE